MDDTQTPPRPPGALPAVTRNSIADAQSVQETVIPPAPRPDRPATLGSETLITLRDRSLDAEKGFATMVDKAEPDFRTVAQGFRSLHAAHAATVGRMLVTRGLTHDDDGSLMGTVNQAVVAVRAFFDRIDAGVMPQIRDGEATVLAAFDAALAAPLSRAEAGTLRRMREELSALLQRTRMLG